MQQFKQSPISDFRTKLSLRLHTVGGWETDASLKNFLVCAETGWHTCSGRPVARTANYLFDVLGYKPLSSSHCRKTDISFQAGFKLSLGKCTNQENGFVVWTSPSSQTEWGSWSLWGFQMEGGTSKRHEPVQHYFPPSFPNQNIVRQMNSPSEGYWPNT